MTKPKEQWGTRLGIILAVAGSAVGLGNFLRFPGLASQNGGGAFMIPYFCALIFLGIPVCWAEWTMGKYGGQFGFNSCPAIFGVLGRHKFWRYIGVLGLLIPIVVYMYYVLIESWCLMYAWHYLTGHLSLGEDPTKYVEKSKALFQGYTGSDQDGLMVEGGVHVSVIFWIITFAVNFYYIYRGLSKGIEKFCSWAMPMMGVLAIIVLVRVLTLGTPNPEFPDRSVLNGLGFMWNPKSTADGGAWYMALADPKIWIASAGQIFFTLSVGFGVIINYASYLKRKDDVVLSGLTASATNEFFEVCLGGLITVPAGFVFLGIAGTVGGTFGLGFNTLPVVFEYMPGGRIFGCMWFFMLFLAAITSSLSMLQPAIAFLEEALGIGRRASCAMLGIVTALGSLFVIYFSKDLVALNTMDFWVGTVLIFVLAMFQVILDAWVFGAKRGYQCAQIGAELTLPPVFNFVIKYVSPTYLIGVFILWSWNNLPGYIEQLKEGGVRLLTVGVIAATLVFLLFLIAIAGPRWQAEGKDKSRGRELLGNAGGGR